MGVTLNFTVDEASDVEAALPLGIESEIKTRTFWNHAGGTGVRVEADDRGGAGVRGVRDSCWD